MKIVRFSDGESPHCGVLEKGPGHIVVLKGDPLFSEIEPGGRIVRLKEVHLLSPVIPRSKVIGIGTNFSGEVRIPGSSEPETILPIFMRTNISAIGPGNPVALPKWSQNVIYEDELTAIIKPFVEDVPLDEVDQVVLGCTLYSDITAHDATDGGPWLKGKSFDTTCPLGPQIVMDPGLDMQNLVISGSVGDAHTTDSTAYMLHTVHELVAYCSALFTLLPGDVITTGCPGASGPIEVDNIVSFEIPEIGRFTNPVIRR